MNIHVKDLLIGIAVATVIILIGIYILKCILSDKKVRNEIGEGEKERKKIHEAIKFFDRLPQVEMTQTEFDSLPESTEINRMTCELDTRFRYPPHPGLEHFKIIGVVVDAYNALESQCGGWALSMPTEPGSGQRFTNRYCVRITI